MCSKNASLGDFSKVYFRHLTYLLSYSDLVTLGVRGRKGCAIKRENTEKLMAARKRAKTFLARMFTSLFRYFLSVSQVEEIIFKTRQNTIDSLLQIFFKNHMEPLNPIKIVKR